MNLRTAAAAIMLATLGACGGSDVSELEAAFCSDLRGDLSLFQVSSQVIDYYDGDRARAAVFIDDAIREGCPDPELLDLWEDNDLYQSYFR